VLFRLARAGALRESHRALFRPEFLTALDGLAGRRAPKSTDLALELRKLLVLYNRQLGAEAT
jgi:hypothetical protein